MKNDKIMGAVVVLAIIIALGSAVVLINNGTEPSDITGTSGLTSTSDSEEGTVGNSLLQSTPDYVKAVAAGIIILSAILIVRRELN